MVNIDLASFSFDTSEILKGASEIKKAIDELKGQQKVLETQGDRNSEQYVQNAADLKTLNSEYNLHVKALAESSKATLDAETRGKQMDAVLNQEAVTIKELRDQNKLLNKLRNDTNVLTEEGQAELKILNDRLDANNALIKENVDQYTQQKIGIGDYAGGIKSALAEMNPFNVSISVFIQNAQKAGGVLPLLTNGFRAVTQGIIGMTKASLAFIATPIGAVIAAVGLVLGAIVGYLKSTQAGMDKLTAVTRPLSAIFQSLIGVLQKVGEFLFNAFSRPQETIKSLYNFVKDKVMKQFEAFGKILEGIFTLNFGKIKEGFSDLADEAKKNIAAIAGAGKEVGKFFDEAIKKGKEIDRLQKEIEQKEIDIITIRAKNSLALKEQEVIMKNQLLTSKERSDAIAEHARLTEEVIKAEEDIIVAQIQQLKIKQSLNDTTREELKQLAELEGALISVQEKRADSQKLALSAVKQLHDEEVASAKAAEAKKKQNAEKALNDRLKKESEIIDLYIQQQLDGRAKTLQEELEIERSISKMRLAQLDSELNAKKISQEAYAKEVLAITQNLAMKEAEALVDVAGREIEAYRRSFQEQMAERRFLSDAVVSEKIEELNLLLEQEKAFAQLKLEQGLIDKQEFDDAIFELTEANRIAIAEVNAEREEVEKQEAIELRTLAFEEELERLLEEGATRFEIVQAQNEEQFDVRKQALDDSLKNQEISQELYNARLKKLNKDKTDAEIANEEILAQEKFKLATGLFDAAASFIDKDSKAGKAIALAKAGMNMYEGISAGLKLGWPASLPAVAFAAGTGLKSIKDITSTKIPSAKGGGDVGGGSFSANLATNLTGQNVQLPSNNANVQDNIEQTANLNNMPEQMEGAVERGASRGTQQGSQEGITNLSANRRIMQESSF